MVDRFGLEIARGLKAGRPGPSRWGWHIDEAFVRINGVQHYLWRAVDHEGEIIDYVVTKKRDRQAALHLMRKLLKRHGLPMKMVTDKLGSYREALRVLEYSGNHVSDKGANDRADVTPAVS